MEISKVKVGVTVKVMRNNGNAGCAWKLLGRIGVITKYDKGDNYCYLDIDTDFNGIYLSELDMWNNEFCLYTNLLRKKI